ncbi:MAG: helix-turn-helix domain-containing protein [Fimbriimonadales bacterium]
MEESVITSQSGVTEPILLRPVDLVSLLQLSRAQVYLLLASGEIPSIRIGRLRRIRRQDLEDWLSRRSEVA